ncbi:MAG: hypothetical protein JW891_00065 [Candidatus Lokiarchaeota archaeon]|nr:hypothetical protein [Candidatus Lokiarchaeota archaeon]
MATKVYTNAIIRNMSSLQNEVGDILFKMRYLEPVVREKVIDFIINVYSDISNFEKQILHGLISGLKDDLWNIRKRIIEFFNDIFLDRPKLINEFDEKLQVLLEEKDIDVMREGLDFLLRIYTKSYSSEDLEKLLKSFLQKDWIAQEKILFLIEKLAIKRKELIKPITSDLVRLLDHDDYLVNKAVRKTIEDIMEHNIEIFDDVFFSFITEDQIDNLESIEILLRHSILKFGFNRFYNIYSKFSVEDDQIKKSLINIIRKISTNNPKISEKIFSQLIKKVLENLDLTNFNKLKGLLSRNNQYPFYLTCLNALKDSIPLLNPEQEQRRLELIKFLSDSIPQININELSDWLSSSLQNGPIQIDTICSHFNIQKIHLIEILKKLMEDGQLRAIIHDDTIKPKESIVEPITDIQFFKQWKVFQNPGEEEYRIKLSVQLKNMSGKKITDLKIVLDVPQVLLVEEKSKEEINNIPSILDENQQLVITWMFKKYYERESRPISSRIKVIIIYQKEDKAFSIKKRLDVLLL